MTTTPPSHRPATGRRGAAVLASVLLAFVLITAGCSGAERPTLVEQGSAIGSADGDPSDGDAADGDGSSDAAQGSAMAESADGAADGRTGPADTSTTSTPTTTATTVAAPVPDDARPPPAGVGAVLSPNGVLVRVTGEVDDGYLVESPCGSPVVIPWGQPVGPVQVVIDPGHGGDEEGAVSEQGLTEASLNLDLARRAAAELTRRSIAVVLTRNGDYRIPIRNRAALADAIAPAAFISIHHNTPASAPSTIPGTEVYVQSTSELSRRLGGLLYESVVAELSQFDVEWTARSDAGVLTVLDDAGDDAYGIARYPATPSALVEMAYLGNPKEEALLATDDYLEVAAIALADGIERYLTTEEAGSGFVDTPRIFNPQSNTGGTDGCVDPVL